LDTQQRALCNIRGLDIRSHSAKIYVWTFWLASQDTKEQMSIDWRIYTGFWILVTGR
jgi:hypothetical protein